MVAGARPESPIYQMLTYSPDADEGVDISSLMVIGGQSLVRSDLDLTIERRTSLGLLSASGRHRSTHARAISGLERHGFGSFGP